MAKEEKKEAVEGEEEGSSGKKKMIMIIVGAILLVGIAVGATVFLIGGNSAEGTDEIAEAEEPEEVKGDPVYIEVKPAFTVNLDPNDPVGFLQVSIQILTFNEEVGKEIETHLPLIKNNLFTLFGLQKSADLRSPEGKVKLQSEVLIAVQDVIDKYGEGGKVDNVFFTNFVMQ